MLGSELKTFKKPDLEHLKFGIDEILEPFCSLANFDYKTIYSKGSRGHTPIWHWNCLCSSYSEWNNPVL